MAMSFINEDQQIKNFIQKISDKAAAGGYNISDIVSEENGRTLQYVDIVMEGGGVLGVALIGYIYALETAGIRFLSAGGTSAGSIAALLLTACADRQEAKTEKLSEILFKLDLSEFIDGDADAKDFSQFIGSGELDDHRIKLMWKGAQVLDNLFNDIGLNPGRSFFEWVDGHMKNFGTDTLEKLEDRIQRIPNLHNKITGSSLDKTNAELCIVAADIISETKVIFPKMAPMYWDDCRKTSPAHFVRASMSIPFFFHPMKIDRLSEITDVRSRWKDLANFDNPPESAVFADGGVFSNFPIDLFHQEGVPDAPTFGVKLGAKKRRVNTIGNLFDYSMALFDSMRHCSDYDFLVKHPDYNRLIGYIDTSGHNWLNFKMTLEEKRVLFRKGVIAAYDFLEKFNWNEYKEIREKLAHSGHNGFLK
ncbi:MAG TPA: patatin-like phospholipase family protein [Leptospiraceae bacterium]|nr:patatin-like phospholipase family protein [Leptospiraceae bacterium]